MPTPYEVEQQLAAELEGLTTAQEALLIAAWAAAWSEVSADLRDTLTDLLDAGEAVTSALIVRSERLAAALAGIADRLEDLTAAAGVTMTTDLPAALDLGVDSTGRLIASQVDDGDDRFDPAARPVDGALEAIIERTTEQMLSTLAPVADETYAVIQRELVRGVAAGTGPRDTAARMVARAEDHFNFGLTRALNVARTETISAYREAARVSQNVHADILDGWVWLAHLGPRTCPACLGRHGTLHPLTKAGPDGHQQCRCARGPVVANPDGGDPDVSWVPSATDHFDGLTAQQQLAVMGPERLRLYQAGLITLADMAELKANADWRDSWVVTPTKTLRALAAQRAA